MIKKLAWLFAVVFVLVGVLGFIPGVTSNGQLLGLFEVDLWHNIVHILTGILFAVAASMGPKAASMWFKIFAVVYIVVALWGFFTPAGSPVLWFITTNRADDWLHLVLAIVIGAIAFGVKPEMEHAMDSGMKGGMSDMSGDHQM